MNSQTNVSVVICAYTLDRWTDLQAAVRSVQDQTRAPSEIILVIDHNDQLFQRASAAFPGLTVIENRQPRGLSGARNSGIADAQGQVIAFMDEDAVADPGWIENLLPGYENPLVAGVGGEVRPMWACPPPDWFPEEFYWVVGCSYKGLPEVSAPIRNPIGCNMSFRKEAIAEAGGFRSGIGRISTIPLGCEETELSIRIRHMHPNWIILHQPAACVYHRVPEWRTRWSYFVSRCYSEGRSKALVAHYVGSSDSLSSERRYVSDTLVKGVLNGLQQALFHFNEADLLHSLSIAAGLMFTATGYLRGVLLPSSQKRQPFRVDTIQPGAARGREW